MKFVHVTNRPIPRRANFFNLFLSSLPVLLEFAKAYPCRNQWMILIIVSIREVLSQRKAHLDSGGRVPPWWKKAVGTLSISCFNRSFCGLEQFVLKETSFSVQYTCLFMCHVLDIREFLKKVIQTIQIEDDGKCFLLLISFTVCFCKFP